MTPSGKYTANLSRARAACPDTFSSIYVYTFLLVIRQKVLLCFGVAVTMQFAFLGMYLTSAVFVRKQLPIHTSPLKNKIVWPMHL